MKKIKILIGLIFTTLALTAQSYKTKSVEVVNYHPQKRGMLIYHNLFLENFDSGMNIH